MENKVSKEYVLSEEIFAFHNKSSKKLLKKSSLALYLSVGILFFFYSDKYLELNNPLLHWLPSIANPLLHWLPSIISPLSYWLPLLTIISPGSPFVLSILFLIVFLIIISPGSPFVLSILLTILFLIVVFIFSVVSSKIYISITAWQIKKKVNYHSFKSFITKYLLLFLVSLFGFFFCIKLILTGKIKEGISISLGYEFLNIHSLAENNIYHFQNIFDLYVPIFISWLCTLLVFSFGPFFKMNGLLMTSIKTKLLQKKKENKIPLDLYVVCFIKSIIVQYPFPFIMGFILHLALFLFPVANLLFPEYFFLRYPNFSEQVAYPSFLSSSIILFLTPVISSFFYLENSYIKYSNYAAKNQIEEKLNNHYLIMGYGNLGRNIIRHTLTKLFFEEANGKRNIKKEMISDVEVLIDRNMEFKAVPTDFVIVNKSASFFKHKYFSSTDADYGFYEALSRDPDLWILGILGDASNLSVLEAAKYKTARIIVNATSDETLPIKRYELLKENKAIMAVPDSASFFTLMRQSIDKDSFIVFPSLIGGNSIASLIFLYLEKLKVKSNANSISELLKERKHKNIITNNQILIVGEGRELFYSLERLKSILSHEMDVQSDKIEFLKECCNILSEDNFIRKNMKNVANDKGYWEISLDRYKDKIENKYKIFTFLQSPLNLEKVHSVFEALKWNIGLIVIFSKTSNRCIKILNNIHNIIYAGLEANIICDKNIPLILISSPRNEKDLLRQELRAFDKNAAKDNRIFPTQRDIQLVHDYTVADEVAAIFRIWSENPQNSKDQETANDPFSILTCINDEPGSFTRCLLLLSGFTINKICHNTNLLPSFHNSNTLIDRKDSKSYIFEGIASLESASWENDFIRGYAINSSKKNLNDRIASTVDSLLLPQFTEDQSILSSDDFECPGFGSICPISMFVNKVDYPTYFEEKRIKLYKGVSCEKPNNLKNKHYAKIWIYGEKANIPGSLAIGMKDLLLIKWDEIIEENIYKDTDKKDLINIKYLSSIECPEKAKRNLRSLYGFIESTNIHDQRNALKQGTLNAICIKAADMVAWNHYAESLCKFLNDNYKKYDKEFINDRRIQEYFPYVAVIFQKKLRAEKLKKLLLKMELFWDENTKEFKAYYESLLSLSEATRT